MRVWEEYAQGKVERSKYRNRKVEYEGETFDSQGELDRWLELKLLERAGEIQELQRQVKFELTPAMRDANGKSVRPITYTADFVYIEKGVQVVEDKKGYRTEVYKIKKKLMLHRYGITIRET